MCVWVEACGSFINLVSFETYNKSVKYLNHSSFSHFIDKQAEVLGVFLICLRSGRRQIWNGTLYLISVFCTVTLPPSFTLFTADWASVGYSGAFRWVTKGTRGLQDYWLHFHRPRVMLKIKGAFLANVWVKNTLSEQQPNLPRPLLSLPVFHQVAEGTAFLIQKCMLMAKYQSVSVWESDYWFVG